MTFGNDETAHWAALEHENEVLYAENTAVDARRGREGK
jgi:hypothetical protein